MNERGELLATVRHTDISFFGPLFDMNRRELVRSCPPSANIEDINQGALSRTLTNPVIARVGIQAVIEALKSGTCGTEHFSPISRQALESYIQTPENINI